MHVSDDDFDASASQPCHHRPSRLRGEPVTLVRRADHPRDVGSELAVQLVDGCLHRADGLPVVAAAYDPVEPTLRTVTGTARDLSLVSGPEFFAGSRLAAREDV